MVRLFGLSEVLNFIVLGCLNFFYRNNPCGLWWAPTFLQGIFSDCDWLCWHSVPVGPAPQNPWTVRLEEFWQVKTLHTLLHFMGDNPGILQMNFFRYHLLCLFLLLVSLDLSFFSWLFLVVWIISPPNDNPLYFFFTIFISHVYYFCHIDQIF